MKNQKVKQIFKHPVATYYKKDVDKSVIHTMTHSTRDTFELEFGEKTIVTVNNISINNKEGSRVTKQAIVVDGKVMLQKDKKLPLNKEVNKVLKGENKNKLDVTVMNIKIDDNDNGNEIFSIQSEETWDIPEDYYND